MQENLERLKLEDDETISYRKEDEEINEQIEKLISGMTERPSDSNSDTESWNSDSFEDETETFDESLEYELRDENSWYASKGELLENEFSLEDESDKEANLNNELHDKDEYIKKINELQEEVNNLKELFTEFSKNLKSEITDIIFEQFNHLESEFERVDRPNEIKSNE